MIQKIVISGGGTGGHIFPAIAIADEIKHRNPKAEILFIGAEGRMEMTKVPKAGYEIIGLPISGIQRSLTWKNILVPLKLLNSYGKVRRILKEFKPEVVVGVGGYASAPSLMAAISLGMPTIIQEQNSFAGLTNKLLARSVKAICVAYEGMDRYFVNNNIFLTGNPVRKDLMDLKAKKQESQRFFDLKSDKKTILLFGGSLGARTINRAMERASERIGTETGVQFIWQCGQRNFEDFKNCKTAQLGHVYLFPFLERMDLAYAVADLVVCRSGALTVSEITLAGKAAVLIPSPYVAEDHQTRNAESLANIDAAVLVKDKQEQELIEIILKLIHNEKKLEGLEQQCKKLGKPNATVEIVNIIEKYS